ncbi:MAG TPA: hypothetical protein VIG74_01135 [Alphaproteobacteria bacterium]|jgi:hypothetical protein
MEPIVIITAEAEDFLQYNIDMSKLSRELRPMAAKLGGEMAIGEGNEPHKHALMIFFNDEAEATAFQEQVQKAASDQKLPGMDLRFEN